MHLPAALAMLFMLAGMLAACGDGVPQPRAPRHHGKVKTVPDDDGRGDDDALPGGGKTPPDDDGKDDGGPNGDDTGGGDDSGDDDSKDDVTPFDLAACGVGLSKPETPRVDTSLHGVSYTKKGKYGSFNSTYEARVSPSMPLKVALSRFTMTRTVTVTTQPLAAHAAANAEQQKWAGTLTFELLDQDRRAELLVRGDVWKQAPCSLLPAKRLSAALGSGSVVVDFDPPLPATAHAMTRSDFLARELAETHIYENIKATVVQSTNANVKAGQTFVGKVTVSPLPTEYQAQLGGGDIVKVGGDVAFEIAFDFGSPAFNEAVGLRTVRYFLDSLRSSYRAVVLDSGDPDAPSEVFIGE